MAVVNSPILSHVTLTDTGGRSGASEQAKGDRAVDGGGAAAAVRYHHTPSSPSSSRSKDRKVITCARVLVVILCNDKLKLNRFEFRLSLH